jgi:hypothetical protein
MFLKIKSRAKADVVFLLGLVSCSESPVMYYIVDDESTIPRHFGLE